MDPPPPPGAHLGVHIEGKVLRNKAGAAIGPFCSMEAMIYSTADITETVAQAKVLGATAVGPLLGGSLVNAAGVRALCDQTLAAGLICHLNFDHAGTAWKDPTIQAVVNDPKYTHLGIEIAVELGSGMSATAWRDQAISTGREISAAFPDRPFRVGLPDGGRNPAPAMRFAPDVITGIGHKAGVWFAPQMYWSKTSGWYQGLASAGRSDSLSFASGLPGSVAAVAYLASVPSVRWGFGTDIVDDVGPTGQKEILAAARVAGADVQSWVADGDGMGNNLFNGTVPTAAGLEVQAAFALFPRITL